MNLKWMSVRLLMTTGNAGAIASGVIVSPSGLVLSSDHVLASHTEGRAELESGEKIEFTVLHRDPKNDFSWRLLKSPIPVANVEMRDPLTIIEGELRGGNYGRNYGGRQELRGHRQTFHSAGTHTREMPCFSVLGFHGTASVGTGSVGEEYDPQEIGFYKPKVGYQSSNKPKDVER